MSGTSGLASPPRPAPQRARSRAVPSPYSLPAHTLRLAATCGVGVLLWYIGGQVARFALLYLGTEISHGDARQVRLVLTMLIFTCIVATQLIVTVGMLHTLRGALTEIRARRAGGGGDERFLVALDRVAPAFAVIYLTWGFYVQDVRDFVGLDQMHRIGEPLEAALFGEESTVGRGLVDMDVRVSLGIAIVAWVARLIFSRRYDAGEGRFSGSAAAFSELAFAFFGLNATITFASERSDWLYHRSVVAGTKGMIEQAERQIPGWEAFWGWWGEQWPFIIDAMVLPLTWLAVGILVFGADINDTRAAIRGTVAERAAGRLDRTHNLTQQSLTKLTAGVQERWIPIAHSIRLTVRGGAPLFGMFCLCYIGLRIVTGYAERGVRELIGSTEPYFWMVTGFPVTFVRDLVVTVLTMCLLAATFDLASTRARALGLTETDGAADGAAGGDDDDQRVNANTT
ncbi:hypothetical protein [Spongiactinospora sp. TRM90649]|uniref:hypothetical protein n=1 Tax=Spongiactinospora sp. TRM90649 TaxID=3031114 RepID=UPI0023F736E9|nr:hypothetical protein [Spongiactinospora sp. TRM90649]MDF5751781.1 hypothetical protein [Spongiactinospora sp. TRM90649]